MVIGRSSVPISNFSSCLSVFFFTRFVALAGLDSVFFEVERDDVFFAVDFELAAVVRFAVDFGRAAVVRFLVGFEVEADGVFLVFFFGFLLFESDM